MTRFQFKARVRFTTKAKINSGFFKIKIKSTLFKVRIRFKAKIRFKVKIRSKVRMFLESKTSTNNRKGFSRDEWWTAASLSHCYSTQKEQQRAK